MFSLSPESLRDLRPTVRGGAGADRLRNVSGVRGHVAALMALSRSRVRSGPREHDLCRSFITNGMLLHKWIDRIREIDPTRIAVSLDGADAPANDRYRGLDGAFEATIRSLSQLVDALPYLAPRIRCRFDAARRGQRMLALGDAPCLERAWDFTMGAHPALANGRRPRPNRTLRRL